MEAIVVVLVVACGLVAIVYYANRNKGTSTHRQSLSVKDDSDSTSVLNTALLGGSSDCSSHPAPHGHHSHHSDSGAHHGADTGHVDVGHFDGCHIDVSSHH